MLGIGKLGRAVGYLALGYYTAVKANERMQQGAMGHGLDLRAPNGFTPMRNAMLPGVAAMIQPPMHGSPGMGPGSTMQGGHGWHTPAITPQLNHGVAASPFEAAPTSWNLPSHATTTGRPAYAQAQAPTGYDMGTAYHQYMSHVQGLVHNHLQQQAGPTALQPGAFHPVMSEAMNEAHQIWVHEPILQQNWMQFGQVQQLQQRIRTLEAQGGQGFHSPDEAGARQESDPFVGPQGAWQAAEQAPRTSGRQPMHATQMAAFAEADPTDPLPPTQRFSRTPTPFEAEGPARNPRAGSFPPRAEAQKTNRPSSVPQGAPIPSMPTFGTVPRRTVSPRRDATPASTGVGEMPTDIAQILEAVLLGMGMDENRIVPNEAGPDRESPAAARAASAHSLRTGSADVDPDPMADLAAWGAALQDAPLLDEELSANRAPSTGPGRILGEVREEAPPRSPDAATASAQAQHT